MAEAADDELDVQFECAAKHVSMIFSQLSAEQLLAFYARFKQFKEGPCNTSRPSIFNFQARQKWDAWKKLSDMNKTQAMEEYVSLLSNIDPQWQEVANNQEKPLSPIGVSVSCMMNTEAVLKDDEKTLFDWVKEGNGDKVAWLVDCGSTDLNSADDEGMGLIHWAADRGHVEVLKVLLQHGADINLQDGDGQTALHYAASCGHIAVLQLLMEQKADQNVADSEGLYPIDTAEDRTVQDLLRQY